MPRPDVNDIELMKGVHNRDSITEMAERTGLSLAGVHGKLEELESPRLGYVNPPRKPGAARDRTLTEEGMQYLVDHGYIPPAQKFEPRIFDR
jgi:predicted transcriptional regulator